MKKSNLIRITAILSLVVLICSFTIKSKKLINEVNHSSSKFQNNITYNKELLIVYSVGTTEIEKQQTRTCLSNSLNGNIIEITRCSINSNAELIRFNNIHFPFAIRPTIGDPVLDPSDVAQPNPTPISYETIIATIHSCTNIAAFSLKDNCSNLQGFNEGQSQER